MTLKNQMLILVDGIEPTSGILEGSQENSYNAQIAKNLQHLDILDCKQKNK